MNLRGSVNRAPLHSYFCISVPIFGIEYSLPNRSPLKGTKEPFSWLEPMNYQQDRHLVVTLSSAHFVEMLFSDTRCATNINGCAMSNLAAPPVFRPTMCSGWEPNRKKSAHFGISMKISTDLGGCWVKYHIVSPTWSQCRTHIKLNFPITDLRAHIDHCYSLTVSTVRTM